MATGSVGPAEPQLCQDGLLDVERFHAEGKYEDTCEKDKRRQLGRKGETYKGRAEEGIMEKVLDEKKDTEKKMELEKEEKEDEEARGRRGRRSSNSRYRRRTVTTRKKEAKSMKVETTTAIIDEWGKDNKECFGLNKSSDITTLLPVSFEQMPSKGTTKLWECSKCEAMFRSKVGLDRHMREDHVFLCFVCGEKLSDKKEYEVHTATQHCTQVARCLSCRTNFPSYNEFREHQEHCSGIRIAEDTQIKAETVNTSPLLQKCIISVDHTNLCHTEFVMDNSGLQESESCEVDNPEQKSKNETECNDVSTRQCGSSQSSGWRVDEQAGGVSQTSKKSEICPHCGKAFQRRSRLLRHINYHFGNKSFKCVTCGKCFVEKGGLVKHELTHDPLHVPCQECGKVCKTRRTLERHLRTHQNKLYTCQTCNKSYKHEESLRIHKRIHNPHGSGHICMVCEQDCMTAQYLRMHLATRHDGHMLSCQLCSKTFKWKQSLRKHMATYHSAEGGSLECRKCEKPMSSRAALDAHKVSHSEARPFSCTICGKAFKQEQVRDRHTAIVHTDQKQFMCPQCGALFKAKAYLSQHISQVHTTSQPSKCMKCNKSFKTKAILKSHIKIVHTEAKSTKYTCTLCGKSFLSPKDLARHSKIHTGAKDVICKVCGRQFSRKDNMMAHIRVHHNGNKTVNNKEFSSGAKTSTDLTSSSTDSQLLPSFSIVPHSSTNVQGSLLTNEMAASNPVAIHPNSDTAFTNSSTLTLDSSIMCSASPDQMINSKELSSASSTIPFSSTVADTVFSLPNSFVVTSTTAENMSSSPVDCIASVSPTCCTTSCVISTSYPSPVTNTSPSSSNRAVSVSLYQPITVVHNTANPCGITVAPISASVSCTTTQAASAIGTLTASPIGTPLSAATVGTSLSTATTSSTSPTVAMAGTPLTTSPAVQPEIITVQTGLVHPGFTTVHTNLAPSFTSGTNGITSGVMGTSGGAPTGMTSPRACAEEDRIYVTTGLVSPSTGGLSSCSSSQQIAQVMTDSSSVGGGNVPLALMLGTASPSLPISTGFTASSPVENTSCLLETGSILIPHPSLLQDTPLIVSEKAGVYTVVECGKLSPLETFTLHAAPNSSQASTTLVVQPLPVLSSTPASSTTTTTTATTTSIISVPSDATNGNATTESSAQMTPTLVLTANVVGSSSSADSETRPRFSS
ncbi:uncharacterized protein LOC143027125 isoform X1 [Oratosquilla oratoria]|uniref:uncharacterized protein LOC143027125 isoform X1 n=1 Tax=Oratosquilla oratoria TaxID=337810 RepID=UPI003F76E3B8